MPSTLLFSPIFYIKILSSHLSSYLLAIAVKGFAIYSLYYSKEQEKDYNASAEITFMRSETTEAGSQWQLKPLYLKDLEM